MARKKDKQSQKDKKALKAQSMPAVSKTADATVEQVAAKARPGKG